MDELKELLDSTVLNESTKQKLQDIFAQQVNEAVAAKTAELKEGDEQKTSEIITAVVQLVEEAVEDEFTKVGDELAEARTLDVRYAQKFEDFKEKYAETKDAEVQESIDAVIAEQMDELKESIQVANNNLTGQKIFETFRELISESVAGQEDDGKDLKAELEESQKQLEAAQRKLKISELTEGLTGKAKRTMTTLLEDVDLDRMETRFETLKESVVGSKTDDDEQNLDESDKTDPAEKEKQVDESSKVVIDDDKGQKKFDSEAFQRMIQMSRKTAGLDGY